MAGGPSDETGKLILIQSYINYGVSVCDRLKHPGSCDPSHAHALYTTAANVQLQLICKLVLLYIPTRYLCYS